VHVIHYLVVRGVDAQCCVTVLPLYFVLWAVRCTRVSHTKGTGEFRTLTAVQLSLFAVGGLGVVGVELLGWTGMPWATFELLSGV
jgi:hypothetical protein